MKIQFSILAATTLILALSQTTSIAQAQEARTIPEVNGEANLMYKCQEAPAKEELWQNLKELDLLYAVGSGKEMLLSDHKLGHVLYRSFKLVMSKQEPVTAVISFRQSSTDLRYTISNLGETLTTATRVDVSRTTGKQLGQEKKLECKLTPPGLDF